MRRISALIASLCLLSLSLAAQAAQPDHGAPQSHRGPTQPYFVMHVKDCTLPMCEEQVVYLTADGRVKFFTPLQDGPRVPNMATPKDTWQRARPETFSKVQQLVPVLAGKFPALGTCDKVRPERVRVTGRLVQGATVTAFRFSDACASQSTDSKSYRTIRELREALQLGVQPLQEG